jgi:hypothetical protein
MSDLQCPATLILLTPETAAVSDVGEYRLSLVIFAHDLPLARAAALSLGGQRGYEAKAADITHGEALRARIAELSDMYRGEQVAVVASAQAICEALRLPAPPTAAVALAVDSDGWRILSR